VGVLVDERDRPGQRAGVGVVPVLNGRVSEGIVREDIQRGGDQEPGRATGD